MVERRYPISFGPFPSNGRQVAYRLFAALFFLILAACQNGRGTVCSGETVDTQWSDCGANQIDDQPRLYNGEAPRRGPVIDVSKLNAEDRAAYSAPFVGFVGTMKVNFAPDPAEVGTDVLDIENAGPKNFNASERVKVDLKDASIDYMLKQLLGGALGVNYIAPADLPGTVTFRTESPIPKSQMLEVVRDLLSRNGLVILYSNGVYHVGPPELIASLNANGAAGRQGDQQTTTIPLRGRQAQQLVELALQIVPQTVKLLPSSDNRSIIMQASANDAPQVLELIQSLQGFSEEGSKVAIIPLRQADPTTVVAQVTQFYTLQFPELASLVTVIPLAEQQAVLAGVRENGMMPDLTSLIHQLDRTSGDPPKVRIIPLQHLAADEVSAQLTQIFGGAGGGGGGGVPIGPADAAGGNSGGGNGGGGNGGDGMTLGLQPNLTMDAPLNDSEEDVGGNSKPPRVVLQPNKGKGGNQKPIDNEGAIDRVSQGFDAAQAAAATGSAGGSGDGTDGPRIVPNMRSNAVMVYSSYEEFQQIKAVLETLDVPQSQVVIEATIAEVDLTDKIDKGVQWWLEGDGFAVRSSGSLSPGDPGGSGGVFQAGGMIGDIRADIVLKALQGITKVKVISSPYLTVVNGKSARLVIGDQIPYAIKSQSSNNSGNVTVTEEIEVKDTGIILEVTPAINANNSVMLKIKQQVSTPSETAGTGDKTPIIKTRDIESEILVQSGRTVMLGGLIQDRLEKNENGVPVLRSIPAVGELFKQTDDRIQRVEMIVMITPRVVRSSSQLEDITRLLRDNMHTRPRVDAGYVVKP